jgi:predicted nucleotidyltransferase
MSRGDHSRCHREVPYAIIFPEGENMRLEHYSAARLAEQARAIFAAHLDLGSHRVFFFGSRVDGTNFERSDIDIGVEGPREVPAAASPRIRYS